METKTYECKSCTARCKFAVQNNLIDMLPKTCPYESNGDAVDWNIIDTDTYIHDKLDRMSSQLECMLHPVFEQRLQDHIEIGQTSKGGVVKVYGDFSKPEEFRRKIDSAVELKNYMKRRYEEV